MSDQAAGPGYPIATICGTTRLHRDMLAVADELTRQGHIVLLPLTRKNGSSLHHPSPVTADELDALHRAKIAMADVVVFVTQEQRHLTNTDSTAWYFGQSTLAEWQYSAALGKATKVVRIERCGTRDRLIWIDDPSVAAVADRQAAPAATPRPRDGARRSARRETTRVVSAHTFRIG